MFCLQSDPCTKLTKDEDRVEALNPKDNFFNDGLEWNKSRLPTSLSLAKS